MNRFFLVPKYDVSSQEAAKVRHIHNYKLRNDKLAIGLGWPIGGFSPKLNNFYTDLILKSKNSFVGSVSPKNEPSKFVICWSRV